MRIHLQAILRFIYLHIYLMMYFSDLFFCAFTSLYENSLFIRHVISAWIPQSFASDHMLTIVFLRLDCFAKWFSYKCLRSIIPQIPHKVHYISSLPKVPGETLRGGLIVTANLIVSFILEGGFLSLRDFLLCHSVQDFPLPGEKYSCLVFAQPLPPSKAS